MNAHYSMLRLSRLLLLGGLLGLGAWPAPAPGQTPDTVAQQCANEPGGGDTHLGGIVTNSVTGAALVGARVEIMAAPPGSGPAERRVVAETHSRLGGQYLACNLDSRRDLALRPVYAANVGELVAVASAGAGAHVMNLDISITAPITIMGTVVDGATGAPVAGAWVSLAGTGFGAPTNQDGRFSFVDVPPGSHVVAASRLGYADREESLTLLRNMLALRIVLAAEAIQLDPVVAEASSPAIPGHPLASRFLGLTAAQMDSVRDRVHDMADLLRRARIHQLRIKDVYDPHTGLRVGICVETSRRIRGLDRCNAIGLAIDGVLVAADVPGMLLHLSTEHVAQLQFLPPMDAGAAYGQQGANGVLLITTRR